MKSGQVNELNNHAFHINSKIYSVHDIIVESPNPCTQLLLLLSVFLLVDIYQFYWCLKFKYKFSPCFFPITVFDYILLIFANSQTQPGCRSSALACVICKYGLGRWHCLLQWPAVWERGRGRVPLLKCQRSPLKLPAAPPPVSLQDTTASATAVLQPCTGYHKGRVTPLE